MSKGLFAGSKNIGLNERGALLFHRDTVSLDRLIAKVLCEHHNNVLGPLDEEAAKLQAAIRKRRDDGPLPELMHVRINGWKLERWALKALLDILAAGWPQPELPRALRRELEPDPRILRVVFGEEPLPETLGLWVVTDPPGTLMPVDSVGFSPLHLPPGPEHIGGILVTLNGIHLVVTTRGGDVIGSLRRGAPEGCPGNWSNAQGLHRPSLVTLDVHGSAASARLAIEFQW